MAKRNLFYLLLGATTGGGTSEVFPLEVTPTTEEQNFQLSQGGYSPVNVAAVTANIDANITPTNIRSGVSILGVEGNLEPDKPDQDKTVTPSKVQQVVRGDTGYELASVTVKATPLEAKTVKSTRAQQTVAPTAPNIGFSEVTVDPISLGSLSITPTTVAQKFTPPESADGYGEVNVSAIDVDKTSNNFTTNGTKQAPSGKFWESVTIAVPQNIPQEVSTSAAMDALLVAANVGKVYKFTGTTDDKYTNGDLYVVEG